MPHVPTDPDVYEVFAQNGLGKTLGHVGSIVSPCPDAAWHLAKETYGRRDDLATLWVVRRADMTVSGGDDGDLLAAKTRMPHRQPGFPTARRRDRSAAASSPAAVILPTAAVPPAAVAPPATAPPATAALPATAASPATVAPPRFRDSAPPERRDDARGAGGSELSDLWLLLADDLFVLGNRLGERIVDYIDLEESLAVGSIGQEALAHAGTILVLSGFDQPAADAWFFDRPQGRWRVSRAIERLTDWPSTVACGLVIAAAVTVLAERTVAVEPGEGWLPAITAVRDEQLVHLDHWRRWARALAAFPETRAEFARAYAEVTERAGDMFGARPQGGSALAVTLHERFAALVGENGGPGSRMPDRPLARTAGVGGSALAYCLSRGRMVRDDYAPGVFQ
ncbi:Phenylacetic acid catabolic protein [Sphaerisporangium corydalis]|uniref:Phenylacetic acid catabolic protein n=1 Tax=Sphaerisporangium corydalis TaxID=1441875 RepID=A0ABV9ERC1_9ACTN|nr:Phenylacetic acid catabolic protein [Sphaerisporangium corydalis]